MVRNYLKKTDRGNVSEETMMLAVKEVKENKRSVRSVSEQFGIPRKTLGRYCDKYESKVTPSNEVIEARNDVRTILAPTKPNEMPKSENISDEVQNSSVPESSSVPDVPLIPIRASSVAEHSKEPASVLSTEPMHDELQGKRAMNSAPASSGVFSSFGYAKRFQVGALKPDFNAE